VTQQSRLIGSFNGKENGILVVFTAAMHGNEKAGVEGLKRFFRHLELQANLTSLTSNRQIGGKILGLLGNMKAYQEGKRYINKDMNRCWQPSEVSRIQNTPCDLLEDEDLEIRELLDILLPEMSEIKKMYLLDLHTTSSEDGIFCIAGKKSDDIQMAQALGVPVVLGLLDGLQGTTLQYFQRTYTGVDTTAIAIEAGHHDDPASVDRCFEACCSFLYLSGCMEKSTYNSSVFPGLESSENKIPKVLNVVYRQPVEHNKAWHMRPGYKNFQKVAAGEKLATYEGQDIVSPVEGYLLMPLYQEQGKDGFFIAEALQSYEDA
jgi:succinylglutamate desuccinylase